MEVLGERAPEVMSERELVHALDQNVADRIRLEGHHLRLLAALDKTGYAERVGARDLVQFTEHRYHLNHDQARRDVLLARILPKYRVVAASLPGFTDSDGAEAPRVVLRRAQAEAIVSELEKVPARTPPVDVDVAEQELVRLARHLAPLDLRKAAEQARNILDTDGPEPAEDKAAARESLSLIRADHGVKFKGYLANENAELLRTLITAGARPHKTLDGAPDPRPREKRQADALSTTLVLAATALDAGTPSPTIPRPSTPHPSTSSPDAGERPSTGQAHGANGAVGGDVRRDAGADGVGDVSDDAGRGANGDSRGRLGSDVVPGFGAKANLTVTIDLQDLQAATADAIGDSVYGNGLSAATIRRLACDANVIPIVLGANSEPLDVGRQERLVTRAMRRALNTRDRGCVVCAAPPVMCDAHHLISWIDGGETAVDNLALLCRRHHTELHKGHWHITLANGTVHVTRPTWADPDPPRPLLLSPFSNIAPGNHPTEAPEHVNANASAAREALTYADAVTPKSTYQSIWGEPPPPPRQPTTPATIPTDPWSEPATNSRTEAPPPLNLNN